MIKVKYNGRTFSSGRSLANAFTKDLNREIERRVRQAASASGARVRKTSNGFEVEGDAKKIDRFKDRLGR